MPYTHGTSFKGKQTSTEDWQRPTGLSSSSAYLVLSTSRCCRLVFTSASDLAVVVRSAGDEELEAQTGAMTRPGTISAEGMLCPDEPWPLCPWDPCRKEGPAGKKAYQFI